MKRFHPVWRYVVWAYAVAFIGWWCAIMVHANPVPPQQIVIQIATVVIGSWFVVRALRVYAKEEGKEWVIFAVLPAGVYYLVCWIFFLIGPVLVAVFGALALAERILCH